MSLFVSIGAQDFRSAASSFFETGLRSDSGRGGAAVRLPPRAGTSLMAMELIDFVETSNRSKCQAATGCALGYLDLRYAELDWRREHSNLARLADKLAKRPSFQETVPPAA